LTVATFATLFFVPIVYSFLRRTAPSALGGTEGDAFEDAAVTKVSLT